MAHAGGGGGGGGGAQGAQGLPGAQGFQGAVGAQGAQGATGSGAQGAQGFQGSVGAQGSQGQVGAQGAQGSAGPQGAQGSGGAQGNQGSTGAQGAQGSTGAQGSQGSIGAQGAQGAQGGTGAQGSQGSAGAQGFQGANGTSLTNWVITQGRQISNQPDYILAAPAAATITLKASASAPFQAVVDGTAITFTTDQAIPYPGDAIAFCAYLLKDGTLVTRPKPPVYRYQDPRSPALPGDTITLWFDLSIGQMKEFSGGVWNTGLDNGSGVFKPALYIGIGLTQGGTVTAFTASEPLYLDPWLRYSMFGSGKDGGFTIGVSPATLGDVEKEYAYLICQPGREQKISNDVHIKVQGPFFIWNDSSASGNYCIDGVGGQNATVASGSGQHGNASSNGLGGANGVFGGCGGTGGNYNGGGNGGGGGEHVDTWGFGFVPNEASDLNKPLAFSFPGSLFGGQGGGGGGINLSVSGQDGGWGGAGIYVYAAVIAVGISSGAIAINCAGVGGGRLQYQYTTTAANVSVGSGGGGGGGACILMGSLIMVRPSTTEFQVGHGLGGTTSDGNGHNGADGFDGAIYTYIL